MPEHEVYHPQYGRGVVKQTRHKGFELFVTFEDGLTRWVRLDELTETKISKTNESPPPPRVFSDERLKSRRMIEAFRLGIVPYDCVEEFTFGRDKEMKEIMDWLNSADESSLLIVGEYGTGKTHLLHYTLGEALQNGFAIAWVEMDPNEAPFHKPKRVYNHLIKNFKYRDVQSGQMKGFRDLLKRSLAAGAFQDHIYFKHLVEHNDEIFWEWIEGSELIPRPVEWIENYWGYRVNRYQFLPGLYDSSTAANIYCYLLSGLGWAATQVLGLQELLLVFDEAETVSMSYYSYQDEKAKNFLKGLIRTANNDKVLLGKPMESGLTYCKIGVGRNVPFLYKRPSGLKLLFAFTSLDWNYEYIWDGGYRKIAKIEEMERMPRIDLQPVSDDTLKEVFEHICLLYDSSYDFLEEDLTIDKLFRKVNTQSGRTRLFVKGSVEALDLVRLNPEKDLGKVLQ